MVVRKLIIEFIFDVWNYYGVCFKIVHIHGKLGCFDNLKA
jgi:hypothetical protein